MGARKPVTDWKHDDLVAKLKDVLPGRPFKVWGNAFQEAGISDFLVCWRGNFICIEVKVPPDKMSPVQIMRMRDFYQAGAYTFEFRREGEKLCCIFWRLQNGEMKSHLAGLLQISTLTRIKLVDLFTSSDCLRIHPRFLASDSSLLLDVNGSVPQPPNVILTD